MKKSPYETTADLIVWLRKHPSEKSDVVLVREMEEHSYIDMMTSVFGIGGLTYFAFDPRVSGLLAVCIAAGILLCCFAAIKSFRKAVRARSVRAFFESQGPQFLRDLTADFPQKTSRI